jgi:protein ImuA
MEEALRCRAIGVAIGEIRGARGVDTVAMRRLSLAAAGHGATALLLRTTPDEAPSTAATRWIVGASPSWPFPSSFPERQGDIPLAEGGSRSAHGIGPPRLRVQLVRNRRGRIGSWIMEWNRVGQCFVLASTILEPVADAAADRPHRAIA